MLKEYQVITHQYTGWSPAACEGSSAGRSWRWKQIQKMLRLLVPPPAAAQTILTGWGGLSGWRLPQQQLTSALLQRPQTTPGLCGETFKCKLHKHSRNASMPRYKQHCRNAVTHLRMLLAMIMGWFHIYLSKINWIPNTVNTVLPSWILLVQ